MATETYQPAEAASSDRVIDRWLAVSEPLAIDDDPDWQILGPLTASFLARTRGGPDEEAHFIARPTDLRRA